MVTKSQIKKWNTLFKSLSKPKQRVLIAKDVLASMKKYRIEAGNYMRVNSMVDKEKDVQSNIKQLNECNCCALGACLISITKYKNKLIFEDLGNFTDSRVTNMLSSVFSPKQLLLIESCFEEIFDDKDYYSNKVEYSQSGDRIGEGLGSNLSQKELKKCFDFQNNNGGYGTNKVLRAIMQNIVANKGILVLP